MKSLKLLILSLCTILGLSTCKKEIKCNDPSNPDCENYDPCLFYSKGKAELSTYAFINEFKVRTNEFLESETILMENKFSLGLNLWTIDNVLQNSKTKSTEYYTFDDTGKHFVTLQNIITRPQECKGGSFIDTKTEIVKIQSYRIGGDYSDRTKPLNSNLKWVGEYKGISDGILNIKNVKISYKKYTTSSGISNWAELSFPNDSCLGIYLIDYMGLSWFRSQDQLSTPPLCNRQKPWFSEVYGIIDNEDNVTICFIDGNTKL